MVEVVELDVQPTAIEGLHVITTKQVTDERGTVREFFRGSALRAAGLDLGPWAQINLTATVQGGLRGIHAEAMTKLVGVAAGAAFGAYVDLRPDSPTHGALVTVELTVGTQVLVPKGVGNGFQATAPGITQYLYCFDDEWAPGMPGQACTPLDPDLAIPWPIPVDPDDRAQISEKDLRAPTLAQLREVAR